MPTRITRVGNTLTVEIPETLARQASLSAGETVEWVPNGAGSLALVKKGEMPAAEPRKRITLEELLQGIPEGARMEDVDWGPPRGAEFW
jgi:antitoxin component of MazEF toxin-antitoxin module